MSSLERTSLSTFALECDDSRTATKTELKIYAQSYPGITSRLMSFGYLIATEVNAIVMTNISD